MNGEVFLAYVQQELVNTLRAGDTVIMDSQSSHKRLGVRQAIEAAGANLVYLPPYSPDLNPIEQAFSKLKTLLRRAAARTVEELENTIGTCSNDSNPKSAKPTSSTVDTQHGNPKSTLITRSLSQNDSQT